MTSTITYSVPGMSCGHCESAVKGAVSKVDGVDAVDVDLETKDVTVTGTDLSDEALRAAIDDAGYDIAA